MTADLADLLTSRAAADAFREGWHAADSEGRAGERVYEGLQRVVAYIEAQPQAWVVSELALMLPGPVFGTHPEQTPVGPFPTREAADAWATAQATRYGGGAWTIAPLRSPE